MKFQLIFLRKFKKTVFGIVKKFHDRVTCCSHPIPQVCLYENFKLFLASVCRPLPVSEQDGSCIICILLRLVDGNGSRPSSVTRRQLTRLRCRVAALRPLITD